MISYTKIGSPSCSPDAQFGCTLDAYGGGVAGSIWGVVADGSRLGRFDVIAR